jgi:hypothetical protein
VVLGAALVAIQGSAASLVEVRVGRHAEFTRVVFETDAPVRYELAGEGEGELRVRLFATATPRRLGSKSNVLREVVIEADPSGAVARLALKQRDSVDVKQMVLDNPPRIVIDLIPRTALARAPVTVTAKKGPAQVAKAEPAPVPAEVRPEPPPPAPAAEGVAEAPAPAPAEPPPAPRAEAEAEAEEAPAPAPAEPVAEVAPPQEAEAAGAAEDESDDQAARDAAAQAELDRLAGVAPMTEPAAPPAEVPAGSAVTPEAAAAEADEPAEAAEEGEAAGFAEGEGYEADAAEVAATPPRAPVHDPGALAFLPSPLDDPLVLGVVVVLLGLVAALAVLRGRAARAAENESLASPFAAAESFAFAGAASASHEAGAPWASGSVPDAAMGPLFANAAERSAEAQEASIFDVAEEDAGRYEECTPPASSMVVVDSEEVPSGAASAPEALGENEMRIVEELERRIAHLETRLEEVADAKERLERHVAAQTEELRVQRAAIARTQRVLRTIAKPDDLATEPAPKI